MTKRRSREAFEHLRPGEEMKLARGGGPLALRGRLARGHERHARGVDPPARGVRRRRLARPRPDAHAGAGGAPRGGDPRLQARAVLAGRGEVRGHGRAPLRRPLPGRQAAARRPRRRRSSRRSPARPGEITKLEKKEEREQPQLLYDLTSLQRHANTLFGFSARRTLAAAQRLYEEHKAITYPRTNSRFLTGDMVPEIKPTAELVGAQRAVPRRRRSTCLDWTSCRSERVVNDAKVQDHHAIIPTAPSTTSSKMGQDELKVYDLVAKRFLAIFHPEAVFERTRVETTVEEHVFRTSGRRLRRGRLEGRLRRGGRAADAERGRLRRRPAAAEARAGRERARRARSSRCARRPSRRGASPRPRCSARWRRPARRSTTPSCARR